jgi:vitamin B12 transporter
VNLERTLTKGIEASAQAQLTDGVNLRAAYAWTDAIDATTGLELYRAPEHTGSVSLDWAWGPASGALTVRAESEQADIDPTTFSRSTRDGFVTADAAVAWMLGDGVEFTARIENLADEDYQEVLGYGEEGRSVFAGFRYRN